MPDKQASKLILIVFAAVMAIIIAVFGAAFIVSSAINDSTKTEAKKHLYP